MLSSNFHTCAAGVDHINTNAFDGPVFLNLKTVTGKSKQINIAKLTSIDLLFWERSTRMGVDHIINTNPSERWPVFLNLKTVTGKSQQITIAKLTSVLIYFMYGQNPMKLR